MFSYYPALKPALYGLALRHYTHNSMAFCEAALNRWWWCALWKVLQYILDLTIAHTWGKGFKPSDFCLPSIKQVKRSHILKMKERHGLGPVSNHLKFPSNALATTQNSPATNKQHTDYHPKHGRKRL